jgi:dephospho-CoA kinase
MARNGFTRAEAESRIAAQASREDRALVTDVVLNNTGNVTQLREQIDALWAELSSAVARQ